MAEIAEEITHSFKAHPYLIGGAVLVLVFVALRSGGSSSTSSAASGLAAGLQSQQLQLQAGVAQTQIADQAATAQAATSAQAQAVSDQTLGSVLGTLVSAKSASDQNNLAYKLSSQQTTASQQIANTQLSDALTAHQSDTTAQLSAYGQSIGLQTSSLADQFALGNKSLDYQNSNLPSLVAFNEYLAGVQSGTAVNIAQIGSQTQENVANTQAGAAETASIAGIFGGGSGGSGGLGSVAGLLGAFI